MYNKVKSSHGSFMSKEQEKQLAIRLRRKGFSYSEILKRIPVAKSTLSLWLRYVGLAKIQRQRLTEKRLRAAIRGAHAKREERLKNIKEIKEAAFRDIKTINRRELWLIGTMLYWAEGSKEKEANPGLSIEFGNSDPYMIKLFLKWLFDVFGLSRDRIKFEIYIHENHRPRMNMVKRYWANITGFNLINFQTVYFKKHKIATNRKNVGRNYHGLLRIRVRASSSLNRKIAGWIEGINHFYWGQFR